MGTSQEFIESRIESEAELELNHIIDSKDELYQFFMGNLSSLENVCNLLVAFRKTPAKAGCLVWQQIENDVWNECKENVRNRYE